MDSWTDPFFLLKLWEKYNVLFLIQKQFLRLLGNFSFSPSEISSKLGKERFEKCQMSFEGVPYIYLFQKIFSQSWTEQP